MLRIGFIPAGRKDAAAVGQAIDLYAEHRLQSAGAVDRVRRTLGGQMAAAHEQDIVGVLHRQDEILQHHRCESALPAHRQKQRHQHELG